MADIRLDMPAADKLPRELSAAGLALAQLEAVNTRVAQLFAGVSDDRGRTVESRAFGDGVTVVAAWRSPSVTVARPWFVARLGERQTTIVDLFAQHAATVVAGIGK